MERTSSAGKELELVMIQLEAVSADLNEAATKLSLLLLTIRRLRKELGLQERTAGETG